MMKGSFRNHKRNSTFLTVAEGRKHKCLNKAAGWLLQNSTYLKSGFKFIMAITYNFGGEVCNHVLK